MRSKWLHRHVRGNTVTPQLAWAVQRCGTKTPQSFPFPIQTSAFCENMSQNPVTNILPKRNHVWIWSHQEKTKLQTTEVIREQKFGLKIHTSQPPFQVFSDVSFPSRHFRAARIKSCRASPEIWACRPGGEGGRKNNKGSPYWKHLNFQCISSILQIRQLPYYHETVSAGLIWCQIHAMFWVFGVRRKKQIWDPSKTSRSKAKSIKCVWHSINKQ